MNEYEANGDKKEVSLVTPCSGCYGEGEIRDKVMLIKSKCRKCRGEGKSTEKLEQKDI